MSFNVDEVSGGPYTHEMDLIRDERRRAEVLNTEPDFEAAFNGVTISPGALAVIKDINKPVELPVGEFVQNVVFHDEEETAPEEDKAEEEPEGDKKSEEGTSQEVPVSKPRHAVESPDTEVKELDDMFKAVE